MNIVADENIPYARELFSTLGEVTLVAGRDLTRADLIDADILLVRSVTRVNQALLRDTPVKFVGTCTIGTDHLDTAYLNQRNIAFSSAPGCNANAVVQYVLAALSHLKKLDKSLRYAVVGCGNVGGRLYRAFQELGFDCIGVDPHLTSIDVPNLRSFEAIYECDVICVHTPLLHQGKNPTYHLFNAAVLNNLKPGCVLLNAGRGEVIDNIALNQKLKSGDNLHVVLDVWENEPNIHTELLGRVKIGTPHIAGYSYEGRVNGSTMIFQALCQVLNKSKDWQENILDALLAKVLGEQVALIYSDLESTILKTHAIFDDFQRLIAAAPGLPKTFDALRKHYPKRREFNHYVLSLDELTRLSDESIEGIRSELDRLKNIGFSVSTFNDAEHD